ncbi:MAG: hypothetical protein ACRDJM_07335 [Actinomycetota bacterium]
MRVFGSKIRSALHRWAVKPAAAIEKGRGEWTAQDLDVTAEPAKRQNAGRTP